MNKIDTTCLPSSIGIVIFGASGDLTMRKLVPSLYQLYRNKRVPDNFFILGVSRTEYSDDTYRDVLREKTSEYIGSDNVEADSLNNFLQCVHYTPMDPSKEKDYPTLVKRLEELDVEHNNKHNYIFYLSTPPSLYGKIPLHLKSVGLNGRGQSCGDEGIRRIIIEKPFGYDLESAKELGEIYDEVFTEDQLFRIDHFLGKETVQNIMALRFSNGIFEPLWNRQYVDRVEVTAVENLGIEKRGGFYDSTGALRDMVQNHLIQLLALVAMEPPAVFNATTFRDEILKVYQSLRPLTKEDIRKNVIRGQYLPSKYGKENKKLKGYREEEKVDPKSRTETYVAMKVAIDNWRWGGVPFYIRTGKQMPTKVTEIVVHFRKTPHSLFGEAPANVLIIRIQPNEGVSLKFDMKSPGAGFDVQQVAMDFTYDKLGGVPIGDAYSRLLEDCMRGDQTLFTRGDAMEASWKYFTPILKAWEEDNKIPLHGYPAGSWGPKISNNIIDDGHVWTNPCKNLTNTDLYCEL